MNDTTWYEVKPEDCNNCYKDFCQCLRSSIKESKRRRILDYLDENNVEYERTDYRRAIVKMGNQNLHIHLSGKPYGRAECSYNLEKWYTYGLKTLVNKYHELK